MSQSRVQDARAAKVIVGVQACGRQHADLLKTLTGEKEIFGAYKKAADYNLDGSVDNKDLVLIAQGR